MAQQAVRRRRDERVQVIWSRVMLVVFCFGCERCPATIGEPHDARDSGTVAGPDAKDILDAASVADATEFEDALTDATPGLDGETTIDSGTQSDAQTGIDAQPSDTDATPGLDGQTTIDSGTQSDAQTGIDAQPSDTGALPGVDHEWSRWRIPSDSPPTSQFQDLGDTVRDNVTGLIWQKTLPTNACPDNPVTCKQQEARDYCAQLTLGGSSNWRLPTAIELISIVDLGRWNPAINTTIFPNTGGASFWSETFHPTNDPYYDYGVIVGFEDGSVMYLRDFDYTRVRCVR